MSDKQEAIKSALSHSMPYEGYLTRIAEVHEKEQATSFPEDPSFYTYSLLNGSRMSRVYKRALISEEMKRQMASIVVPQHWMLITESWCGDAAQTVPLIVRLAELNPLVQMHIVLRDSEPQLMEHFLTNGGQSIPILAILDESFSELTRWGPRPAVAQQIVMDYKALPEPRPPYEALSVQIQKWYNADKGVSAQAEICALLHAIS